MLLDFSYTKHARKLFHIFLPILIFYMLYFLFCGDLYSDQFCRMLIEFIRLKHLYIFFISVLVSSERVWSPPGIKEVLNRKCISNTSRFEMTQYSGWRSQIYWIMLRIIQNIYYYKWNPLGFIAGLSSYWISIRQIYFDEFDCPWNIHIHELAYKIP